MNCFNRNILYTSRHLIFHLDKTYILREFSISLSQSSMWEPSDLVFYSLSVQVHKVITSPKSPFSARISWLLQDSIQIPQKIITKTSLFRNKPNLSYKISVIFLSLKIPTCFHLYGFAQDSLVNTRPDHFLVIFSQIFTKNVTSSYPIR